MPCCAAVGCHNKEHNVRLFRFPRDEERRKLWEIKVKREGWSPNDNSQLCEVGTKEAIGLLGVVNRLFIIRCSCQVC